MLPREQFVREQSTSDACGSALMPHHAPGRGIAPVSQAPGILFLPIDPFSQAHHLRVKHHLRLERERACEDVKAQAVSDPYDLNEEAC